MVCQKESDPLTPCLPDLYQEKEEILNVAETENNDQNNNNRTKDNKVDHSYIKLNKNTDNIHINNFQTVNSTDNDEPYIEHYTSEKQRPRNCLNRVFNC